MIAVSAQTLSVLNKREPIIAEIFWNTLRFFCLVSQLLQILWNVLATAVIIISLSLHSQGPFYGMLGYSYTAHSVDKLNREERTLTHFCW